MSTPDTRPVILLTFANDRNDGSRYLRNLSVELHEIRNLLEPLDDALRIKVDPRPNVTPTQIIESFTHRYRNRVAIFHFGGHSDSYQLLMESIEGDPTSLQAESFADLLKQQRGIKLVFLNGCANQAHVQSLIGVGIDAVIATSNAIDDRIATEFAIQFYRSLSGGATISEAYKDAVVTTQRDPNGQVRDARLLYVKGARSPADSFPWQIHYRPGAEDTAQWTLPEAPPASVRSENFLWVGVPTRANLDQIVGRDDLLDDLVQRFHDAQQAAISLSADGLPGVGKTTMALLLAHDARIQAHFTDGVLWAGLGPTPDVASIQASWAEALGLDLRDEADPHKRQARLSAAIGNRRVLVVIDDAWELESAQLLRVSGPHVAHLLTTRNSDIARRFAGAEQALKVTVLNHETAWELLQQLAPEACAADPVAAREMVTTAGGLPLAIELLGGYLAAPEHSAFADLSQAAIAEMGDAAARLKLAQERLGHASAGEQTLAAVIQLSLDDLARVDAAAVDAFHALGAFAPKPATFDRPAAEAVTGASLATLARLISRNLLERNTTEHNKGESLAVHQVVHHVAATQTFADAVTCHRRHYLQEVNQDNEDWQHIDAIYAQLKQAWKLAQCLDLESLLAFTQALGTYQRRRGLWYDRLAWLESALTLTRADTKEGERASLLNNIGVVYSALGDKQHALSFFNQALPLQKQVGDKSGEANTLNNIGVVYSALGDKQQALSFFNQALPLLQQVDDKSGEATTLNNCGSVYSALGDKQQALSFFDKALPLRKRVGDKSGEATTLNNIGRVYDDLGDKQQALSFFNQALPLQKQVGDISGQAATLNNIGRVYGALGDKQQALKFYNQALPLQKQVGDKAHEATTLNNIGRVYDDLGDKQQALKFFNQALPLLQQVGDKAHEAGALNNIGGVYSTLGDKQQALKFFNQALPLHQQVSDISGQATTLNNIGGVYDDLGDKQQALKFYNQALPLRQQVGDISGQATTLNNIGRVYSDLGDKQQALKFFNQALPLLKQVGDISGQATTLNNIGRVYSDLGDKQQALKFFNQALPLLKQVGDISGQATTLNNIGRVYSDLGDKQQALKFFNQALPLRQQVGDKAHEAGALNNIGGVYDALGDKQQALKFFNQALPLRQQVGDISGQAVTLANLLLTYWEIEEFEHALEFMRAFLICYDQLDLRVATALGLEPLAQQIKELFDKQSRNE